MKIGQALRIGAALALLVAGLVHLDLYFGGYRSAGSVPAFGRSIMLDAIAFGVVAAAVAARREWFVRVAGIVVPAATVAAFAYTHRGHTLLGFRGSGLEPSPQAVVALVAELAAIVLLAATFIPAVAARDESSGIGMLAGAGVATAIVLVGFGLFWSNHYETTATPGTPTSVVIKNFAFSPSTLTVRKGSTVTWTNDGGVGHTVSATDRSFTSRELQHGATFQFTFDTPGSHAYICAIHPDMMGTITVTP
jgi:plastocyanin